MQNSCPAVVPLLFALLCPFVGVMPASAAAKTHTVTLGPSRHVSYTPPEASAEQKSAAQSTLRVRPLFVDSKQKEWTVGEIHDVTDRTFVVRRALRINDSLPAEQPRWTWQPGPWLMVDRMTGHVAALHLPAFDPVVSNVVWFRDYAAYCGIATTIRNGGLVGVVAELGARKAIVQKVIGKWPQPQNPLPACAIAKWDRSPMRATIQLTGGAPMTFDVVGLSSLVEEGEGNDQ